MGLRKIDLPAWLQHALFLCAIVAAGIAIFTIFPIDEARPQLPGKVGQEAMWPVKPEL